MTKKFIRKSQINAEELHLYREVERNIGHSGHHTRDGTLPIVEEYDPFMILRKPEDD